MKKIALKLADNALLKKDNEFLKKDTLALHKEINRKENVIVNVLRQRDNYRSLTDTLRQLVDVKDEIIAKKVDKPKRWGIGLVGGYGLSGKGLSTFIGVGVMRTFIRF